MKGHVLQISHPSLQSKEEITSVQAKYPPSNATLKRVHQSTTFVPVLVFIPGSVDGDQVSLRSSLGGYWLEHLVGEQLTEVVEKGVGAFKEPNEMATLAFGDVAVDFLRMEAFRKNEPVALTTLHFKTLRYLTLHARRVISRDELLNEVWGYNHYPTTRTVDNVILQLRQKLELNPSRPVHFLTIRGTGYKFLP